MEDPKQDVNEPDGSPGGAAASERPSGAPKDLHEEQAGAKGQVPEDETVEEGQTPEHRLALLLEERDKLKDKLLRTAADLDNFRKRARRDVEDAALRGREDALREILPVVDNLERAVEAAAAADNVAAVAEGVRMVLRYFEDTAAKMGLERVASVGERFDPNVHDAVQQEETAEHPPGTVVRELVPGYRLGAKLLRPALVVVARPPAGGGEGS
jgi:molecular chaperone GrpE